MIINLLIYLLVVPLEISLVPDTIRAVLGDPVIISVIGNRDFGDGINISWSRADGSPLPSYVRVGGDNGDQIVIPSVQETLDIVVTVIDIVGTIVTKSVTLNSGERENQQIKIKYIYILISRSSCRDDRSAFRRFRSRRFGDIYRLDESRHRRGYDHVDADGRQSVAVVRAHRRRLQRTSRHFVRRREPRYSRNRNGY